MDAQDAVPDNEPVKDAAVITPDALILPLAVKLVIWNEFPDVKYEAVNEALAHEAEVDAEAYKADVAVDEADA